MKVIKYDNALKGKNSDKCKTLEYSFMDKDIDLGIATISGRYPDDGYGVNLVSKEFGVRIDIWTHFMRGCIIDYVY